MRVFESVEDLQQATGTHLGFSDWHIVTQDQIDTFARATGDQQWIHVDPAAAAEGPFGTTIAHGFLTLSLVPRLVWQVYQIDGEKMVVNYGVNKVRFPAPVPVNSSVRAGVELMTVTPGSGGNVVVAKVSIERQGGEKPVCVVETVSIVMA
jgi:acyl dehydratase